MMMMARPIENDGLLQHEREQTLRTAMNLLSVDTSSDCGSIAVLSGGRVLGEIRLANSIHHSERLFRSIEYLFQEIELTLNEIDIFAAARGPGSFTGLRVGLSAMEGFAFARKKAAIGVSTLAATAWQIKSTNGLISPVLDARRSEIYAALYRRQGEELIELCAPTVLKTAQWLSTLPAEPIVFCGNAVGVMKPGIAERSEWEVMPVSSYLATAVAEISVTSGREPLEPLYVRPLDAEVNRSG